MGFLNMVMAQIQGIQIVTTMIVLYIIRLEMESGIQKVKEIPIIIKIKANKKSREIIKNLSLDISMDITNIGLCDCNACSFPLTLYLKQREGFLNKMLYRYHLRLKDI